eukprot:gene46167-biopygen39302
MVAASLIMGSHGVLTSFGAIQWEAQGISTTVIGLLQALAVAAAEAWTERARPMFDMPPHTKLGDPLARLLGHIDFRFAMLDGPVEEFTCFVGTMVQEAFATSDAIRAACEASINAYCQALAPDIQAAIDLYGAPDDVTAIGLAQHVQSVLQGAFVLAKTTNDPAIARGTVTHLKRYVRMLFAPD